MPDPVPAVATPKLRKRCSLSASTLNYWISSGIVGPSAGKPRGQRYVRWWSLSEATAVRAIKVLRDTGCPMPIVRTVAGLVDAGPDDPGNRLLQWDGGAKLHWVHTQRRRSVSSRQRLARVSVVLPIAAWFSDAADDAEMVDPAEFERQWATAVETRPRRAEVEVNEPGSPHR
jgi:DNA-binding transcriptional MerR regulator